MNKIHPLATVSPNAKLGDNIEIGPYVFVDDNVEIGDGCKLLPHAVIFSYVKMGSDCTVFPGAVVGAIPQDLKYEGEVTWVEIGDRVTIRECATINRGTKASGKFVTKVGSDTARVDMPYSDSKWHKVVMDDVTIQGGSVEVGFFADAPANAWCHIDDVSLIRTGEIGDDLGLYDVDATGVPTAYYSLSGERLSAPRRGVNVVRKMVNGKIRSYKVVTN